MCYNPIILQQYYDSDGHYHCYYYADYNPDIHSDEVLTRLSLGLQREHMHKHKFVVVPCGKCKECRARLARDWKIRLYHHSLTEGNGIFVTLTYDDEHLEDNNLNYRHFQLFMKRLRRAFPNNKISYFVAGEYGTDSLRRHFHAIIFGIDIKSVRTRFLCRSRKAKDIKIWTSDIISKCWDYRGFVSVSEVVKADYRVFGYVSGYIISKSDEKHLNHVNLNKVVPEFHHMSLKPAIGKKYFLSNYKQIYRNDYVILSGHKFSVPRAYDSWFKSITSRLVIREGVSGFGLLKVLQNIKDKVLQMAYLFKYENRFSFTIDKISDFDKIKLTRKRKASAFTCSDYNLESRRFNLSKYLFSSRDIEIGGAYV